MKQELSTIKTDHLAGFAKQFTNIQRVSDVFLSYQNPLQKFIDAQNKQAEMLKQAFQPLYDLQNALNLSNIRTLGNIATPIASLAHLTENKPFPATPAPKRKPVIIDHEPISLSDTQHKEQQTKPRKSRKQLQRENIALQAKLEAQQTLIETLVNALQARPNELLTKANQTIDDQQKQIETLQAQIDRLQALVGATATPANDALSVENSSHTTLDNALSARTEQSYLTTIGLLLELCQRKVFTSQSQIIDAITVQSIYGQKQRALEERFAKANLAIDQARKSK